MKMHWGRFVEVTQLEEYSIVWGKCTHSISYIEIKLITSSLLCWKKLRELMIISMKAGWMTASRAPGWEHHQGASGWVGRIILISIWTFALPQSCPLNRIIIKTRIFDHIFPKVIMEDLMHREDISLRIQAACQWALNLLLNNVSTLQVWQMNY